MGRRGSRTLKARKSVKRLWKDRVRENSVVKQFGPRNSQTDNIVVQRVTLQNVLGLMRNAEGATLVSSSGEGCCNGQVTKIPLVIVTEGNNFKRPSGTRGSSAVPLVESCETGGESQQCDPFRKYIVLPAFDFTMKNIDNAAAPNDSVDESTKGPDEKWPDASHLMRGMTCQKISVDGHGAGVNENGDNVEVSSVSYLSVPNTSGARRPSTADLVIEKLKVEKVEGGGLSIQGVSLASNCHITLCVFGTFFMVAGLILSYVSFSVTTEQDKETQDSSSGSKKGITEHISSVEQMRKIGPSFIFVGLLMLILGITFYALAKKIASVEKAHRRVISERQLNQLESSFNLSHSTSSPMHTIAPAAHEQYPILSVRRNSWWVDPPPVEDASPVNPEARDLAIQCPSPHGDNAGVTPPTVSPVPSEMRSEYEDTYVDIACFPTPPVAKVNSEPSMVAPITSGSPGQDPSGQGSGQVHSQPASANGSNGRSYPAPVLSDNIPSSATTHLPQIQVTAAQPNYIPTIPQLPRLSRHCSTRMDSRPTTADSR